MFGVWFLLRFVCVLVYRPDNAVVSSLTGWLKGECLWADCVRWLWWLFACWVVYV